MKEEEEKENLAIQEEAKKIGEERRQLRLANIRAAANRPGVAFLKSLDSSIKKNTSIIKKLKTSLTEESKESLLNELKTVNLSRYISEIVAAIVEAKLKPSDVNAAVRICSFLHQRYSDFTSQLIPALGKVFPTEKQKETEQEKSSKFAKRRVTLRFLGELYILGVHDNVELLYTILQEITGPEQFREREPTYHDLSLVVSFVKTVGEELLDIIPASRKIQASMSCKVDEKDELITEKMKQSMITTLNHYFSKAAHHLVHEHKELRNKEKENNHIMETKGELSENASAAYDRMRKAYEKLILNVTTLADLLNKESDMPTLPEESNSTRVEAPIILASTSRDSSFSSENSIWDDEETKNFYENLADLRALVPAVLFGEEPAKEKNTEAEEKEEKEEKEEEKTKEKEEDKPKEKEKEREKEVEPGNVKLDLLLQKLPTCVNRDAIDKLAIEFCYLNSKPNRKKLVKALFNVPRTQLALFPYYAACVATLGQCMKDIGPMLVSMLEEEFHFLYQKKDQINIETKIRNIRLLGELTKFRVAQPSIALNFLKLCLDDFVHHNIDVACNLLETCGRFLYRNPETHVRTKNLLEIMMRLKNAQNLHSRLDMMVENAYYQCVPPERAARKHKDEPPLRQYMRKLIYEVLNKTTTKYVLKQLRKLPWNEDNENFILNRLIKVYKGKYSNIHLVASLVAGLASYHEMLGIKLVDGLLEEIRLGLEQQLFQLQQRQIMNVKLLGELYNYCMVESQVIFDTLYTLITFGHDQKAKEFTTQIDPPTDCFRIRMICTLLDTCGQYFDRGSSKRKLDRYLVYFQKYILSKQYVPSDVEFMISDTLEILRPNLKRYATFEQACEEVAKIEEQDKPVQTLKVKTGLPPPPEEEENESDSEESDNDLNEDDMDDEEDGEDDDGDDDDDEDDEEEDKEEEEDVVLRRQVQVVEDPAFDREFQKMIQESLEARKLESRANTRMEMSIPLSLIRTNTGNNKGRTEDENDMDTRSPEDRENSMQFRLLLKKGNRQTITKNLHIPIESKLAANSMKHSTEREEQQQQLKEKILQYEEQEEEDQQEERVDTTPRSSGNFRGQRGKRNVRRIMHVGYSRKSYQ